MARMMGTDWQGEHGSRPMSRYDVVCVHTIVGNPPAHAAHFSIRADGWVYQSRDTRYQSAANLVGNPRVIAIENDDHGAEYGSWNVNDGHAVPALTTAQVEANAKICAWAHQTHGIPLVVCPNSKPSSRGVAYHRQGIDGNWAGYAYGGRVSGGEMWTEHFGKVCPGDRRIKQVLELIIPRARQLAGLTEGDDVSVEDVENMMWKGGPVPGSVASGTLIANVEELERLVWKGGSVIGTVDPTTVFGRIKTMEADLLKLETKVDDAAAKAEVMDAKLDQIIAKLNEEPPPPTGL